MGKIQVKYYEEVGKGDYLETKAGIILARHTSVMQPPAFDPALEELFPPDMVASMRKVALSPPIMWNGQTVEIESIKGKKYAVSVL